MMSLSEMPRPLILILIQIPTQPSSVTISGTQYGKHCEILQLPKRQFPSYGLFDHVPSRAADTQLSLVFVTNWVLKSGACNTGLLEHPLCAASPAYLSLSLSLYRGRYSLKSPPLDRLN